MFLACLLFPFTLLVNQIFFWSISLEVFSLVNISLDMVKQHLYSSDCTNNNGMTVRLWWGCLCWYSGRGWDRPRDIHTFKTPPPSEWKQSEAGYKAVSRPGFTSVPDPELLYPILAGHEELLGMIACTTVWQTVN